MNEKYYNSSNKFSWKGILVMFLTFLVVGTGLSWVYLWINRVCPSIYLCIFAAIGFGALVGLIARLVVKGFKIRSVKAVLIGSVIGLLCMNYLKWAIYDYYDYVQIEEQLEEYVDETGYFDDMKKEYAYTYYEMDYDFDETEYTFEENWEYLTENNAYEYLVLMDDYYPDYNVFSYYTDEEIEDAKSQTLYEFYSYDILLGTTKEECQKNLAKAKEMTAYEFYYNYREIEEAGSVGFEVPSLIDIITDPGMLWGDIKDIAEEGRWSFTSTSSSGYSSGTTTKETDVVKGGMLWLIWGCELVILCLLGLLIPIGQAKKIFIESDDNWAKTYDNNAFTFGPVSKSQAKAMLEQTPDNIANMMPVRAQDIPRGRPYTKMTLSHSEDFLECYINVLQMTYNAKNHNYVSSNMITGLRMRPKHTGMLFTMFGLQVPGRVASDPEFMDWDRMRAAQLDAMREAQAAQQPQMQSVDSGFDANAYEQWKNGNNF